MHSLCPNIYGHEMVKAGLILSLFGGSAKRARSRDDVHILLVGDPGLGKSQMLQACCRISAKGINERINILEVFVCTMYKSFIRKTKYC